MLNFTATWKQFVADLQRELDELKVKKALGRAALRDLLSKADDRLHELKQKARGSKDSKAVRELRALLAKIRRGIKNEASTPRKERTANADEAL